MWVFVEGDYRWVISQVHNHDYTGVGDCLERTLPDGSLRGECLPPSFEELTFKWPDLTNIWGHGAVSITKVNILDELPPEPIRHRRIEESFIEKLKKAARREKKRGRHAK